NSFDDAVASIVHHQYAQIELLLHRGPQLADIEKEAAVARHADRLPVARRRGGAHGEGQTLADPRADREHTLMRRVNGENPIAPGGVVLRHIANPDRVLWQHIAQLFAKVTVHTQG